MERHKRTCASNSPTPHPKYTWKNYVSTKRKQLKRKTTNSLLIPHHHNQTRRLTGFEITSIQVRIFTSVSILILYYCKNHPLNLEESKWREANFFSLKSASRTRPHEGHTQIFSSLSISPHKEIVVLNFIFYFLLYKYHITPIHGVTPTATKWHTKAWNPELQKQVAI